MSLSAIGVRGWWFHNSKIRGWAPVQLSLLRQHEARTVKNCSPATGRQNAGRAGMCGGTDAIPLACFGIKTYSIKARPRLRSVFTKILRELNVLRSGLRTARAHMHL